MLSADRNLCFMKTKDGPESKKDDMESLVHDLETIDDKYVVSSVNGKLSVIFNQIEFLQKQTRDILLNALIEDELHKADCNVAKRPGSVYYYYKRPSGKKYLSIMSPDDWGKSCPYDFLGAYRLEFDNSWIPFNETKKFDERRTKIQELNNLTFQIRDVTKSF